MYENGVRVQARKRVEIEDIAYLLRKGFGFAKKNCFPLMEFLEHGLQSVVRGFYYDIRDDATLDNNARALAFPDKSYMLIEASVYDGACDGIGKDRMTIAHEIGHMLLHSGVPLARRYETREIKVYENSEWQADVFAGELLAPIRLIKGMNPFEIAEECQVSVAAAKSQLRALDKRLHR